MTLPRPLPFLVTVSFRFCSVKVAVIAFAPLRTKVQRPVPAQPPPDQPVKSEPTPGVAVSANAMPFANCPEQAAPQLIPAGDEVTVPEPVPALVTVTAEQLALVVAEALAEPPFALVKLAPLTYVVHELGVALTTWTCDAVVPFNVPAVYTRLSFGGLPEIVQPESLWAESSDQFKPAPPGR